MAHRKDSQVAQTLNYLQTHEHMTSWDAITNFHCTRLAVMINTLRKEGYDISSTIVYSNGKHYAEYRLTK